MSGPAQRRTAHDGRPATHAATRWRGEAALAMAMALAAVLLITIAFNQIWPLTITIGVQDERFVAGFHAMQPVDGRPARWTTESAQIALPQPPLGASTLIELRMSSGRPPRQPDAHVQLDAAGTPVGAFDVVRIIDGTRRYRALLPPAERFGWALRLGLQSSTFTLPNDSRQLGAVVDRVIMTPLAGGVLIPSLWLLVWGAGLGLLGYALPRGIGLGRGVALACALALAALVAWGIAARPLELLPFVQRIVVLLGLGTLGIALARLLAPPVIVRNDRHAPSEQALGLDDNNADQPASRTATPRHGRLALRGADLPIYLAVAWWMAPLFQLFQNIDGIPDVGPGIPTLAIGGAIGLALLGLAGWYALRGRAQPPEQARAQATRAALAIFGLAALANLVVMIVFAFGRQGPDFWILFKGARDWARGGSLYDLVAVRTNHFGKVFKVPPFYGMLFVPWVFQDGERVLLFHRALNCLLLGATVLAWLRMWGLRSLAGVAGVLVLLNFRPIADTIAYGQIDLALLLALTLALWALRDERDVLAGVLIALGTLFKIYPVLLLAFLVIKRRWRGLAGFGLGMLLFNGLAVAVIGWEMHRIYLSEVLPSIGGTTSWVENQTISAFITRLESSPAVAEIFQDRALARLGLGISALVGLGGCVLVLAPARTRGSGFALQYGLFPLLMVLVVPAAWMHYETLLFLPLAALLLHETAHTVALPRAAMLALSYTLVAYGNQWSFYGGTVMGILTIAGVSYKLYGMLLLGGVLAATLLAERAPAWIDLRAFLPGRWRGDDRLRAPAPPAG